MVDGAAPAVAGAEAVLVVAALVVAVAVGDSAEALAVAAVSAAEALAAAGNTGISHIRNGCRRIQNF